jgi:ribosomal protein L11 methyltransferase
LIRLAVRVRRAEAELVLAELLSLAPSGVEEVDAGPDTVEFAVYGPPGELPELPALRAAAGSALIEVSTTEIADDWAERWREFHRPLVLGDRLCVRPPWAPLSAAALDVVIDPGRAFGTGAHPTTRLCLELLLELPVAFQDAGSSGFAAVDLGCGSGVLAIAAARLGHAPVLALDHDQLAVDATIENASVNRVGGALVVRRFDLRDEPVPEAPLVLANLLAPLLRDWCWQLASGTAALPDAVIASGVLAEEAEDVSDAFAAVGLLEADRRESAEWSALRLVRAAGG